jgi:hypothetical protein
VLAAPALRIRAILTPLFLCHVGDGELRMQTETVIYEPPKDGLPYLVVMLSPDGVNVLTAKSRTEARTMVSERAIARRRRKPTTPLGSLGSPPTTSGS